MKEGLEGIWVCQHIEGIEGIDRDALRSNAEQSPFG